MLCSFVFASESEDETTTILKHKTDYVLEPTSIPTKTTIVESEDATDNKNLNHLSIKQQIEDYREQAKKKYLALSPKIKNKECGEVAHKLSRAELLEKLKNIQLQVKKPFFYKATKDKHTAYILGTYHFMPLETLPEGVIMAVNSSDVGIGESIQKKENILTPVIFTRQYLKEKGLLRINNLMHTFESMIRPTQPSAIVQMLVEMNWLDKYFLTYENELDQNFIKLAAAIVDGLGTVITAINNPGQVLDMGFLHNSEQVVNSDFLTYLASMLSFNGSTKADNSLGMDATLEKKFHPNIYGLESGDQGLKTVFEHLLAKTQFTKVTDEDVITQEISFIEEYVSGTENTEQNYYYESLRPRNIEFETNLNILIPQLETMHKIPFIFVGKSHLTSPNNVLETFEKMGYKVARSNSYGYFNDTTV